jgi:hypothetical protein
MMSNFLQHAHKMFEYQLRGLEELGNEGVISKLTDMAEQFGTVRLVKKLGEENYHDKLLKAYLISFEKASDAMDAAYAMEGRMLGKTSMMLMLH